MGLMMLAAGSGSKLRFSLEGPAKEAVTISERLESLFKNMFEEI